MTMKNRTTVALVVVLVICLSAALVASTSVPSAASVKAQAKGQVSNAESTLGRQKLRAQALADEVGALVEQAARKILGSHYTNVYSSWTSFRWRMAPFLSRARVHINTAVAYISHLTTQLEATILNLTSTHKSSLGAFADHLTTYASVIAKAVIAFGAIAILALLQRLRPRRANAQRRRV